MATRRRKKIRRRSKPVEEYEEVEDLEGEDVEDLEDDVVEEEEDEEPPPKAKRQRRKRAPRKVEPDDEEDWDDDEGEDEPPSPKPAASKKAAPPAKKKDIEVKKVDNQVAEGVLSELLEALDAGQSILVTRLSSSTWQFANAETVAIPTGPKLKGKEFDEEVLTVEYREWHDEWKDMTYQEKKAYAKKLKVKWDEHEDQRVDNIRMSSAVRAKLNVEKYKPEYSEKSARDRLKGK